MNDDSKDELFAAHAATEIGAEDVASPLRRLLVIAGVMAALAALLVLFMLSPFLPTRG